MEEARVVLRDTFNLHDFRLSQEKAIEKLIVDNKNALVVFPTGGGKSLVYQIPALCLEGLTIVISPLISLMTDQVQALKRLDPHMAVAKLDSTLSIDESRMVKSQIIDGTLKLLYVAPERLNNESFMNMMSQVKKISLLAVDEAHCISQWGAAFRPDYLKIARFAEEYNVERTLTLTATATLRVCEDICAAFNIEPAGVFRTPVYRPNLAFQVQVAETLHEKIAKVVPFLRTRTGPAIIYVTLQKQCEETSNLLSAHELISLNYHAGLSSDERRRVQDVFMNSDDAIVVSTIAFGMGIDKANIRQVVHLYLPKTLENYSQEVGRAGRDGNPSTCLMFLSKQDIPVLEGFARGDTPSKANLELWLQEVALTKPASDKCLDFNLYEQGKTYDMRANLLSSLYASLELDFGFVRAVTPFYSMYELSGVSNAVKSDNDPAAKAIRQAWSFKNTDKFEVDVVRAAKAANVERADLARKISQWEMSGSITSARPSQVRARYLTLEPLPKTPEQIQNLAEVLYKGILEKEEENVAGLQRVISLVTDDDCIANGLARYFGDENSIPDGLCGSCTFCKTGDAVEFTNSAVGGAVDCTKIMAILDACYVRDDPRMLARMAFGITSPRLTANKWSTSHALFGSLVDAAFPLLVTAFDAECKKAGYVNGEIPAAPTKRSYSGSNYPTAKRSYSGSSSYNSGGSNSYRGGRGGHKRKY